MDPQSSAPAVALPSFRAAEALFASSTSVNFTNDSAHLPGKSVVLENLYTAIESGSFSSKCSLQAAAHDNNQEQNWSVPTLISSDFATECPSDNFDNPQEPKQPTRIVVTSNFAINLSSDSVEECRLERFKDWLDNQTVNVNPSVFASLIQYCGDAKDLPKGRAVHECIVRSGHGRDRFLGNLLIEMYGKCGAVEAARSVFNELQRPNLFSWNIIIVAYINNRHMNEAVHLFQQMQSEGLMPDQVTFVSILGTYTSQQQLAGAKEIHASVVEEGFESNVFVGTALVNVYDKCCSIEDALRLFEKMPSKDVVSWNAIILALSRHGYNEHALQFYQQMAQDLITPSETTFISVLTACSNLHFLADGRTIHAHIVYGAFDQDVSVPNGLITMYSKCGNLKDAQRVFDKMHQRNIISWNAMISAHVQHGSHNEALQVFQHMQLNCQNTSEVTIISILAACVGLEDLEEGMTIHAFVVEGGFQSDMTVMNSLVNMYSKCGNLEDARRVFDSMHRQDVVSWTIMMGAYAEHGQGKDSLQLFKQMRREGLEPSDITCITVLGTCASIDTIEEGIFIHASAVNLGFDAGLFLGTALVNMYSNCGSLQNALRIFDKMHEHDLASWDIILTACLQHGKSKEALQMPAKMLQEGIYGDESILIKLLTRCASLADPEEAKKIHAFMLHGGFESNLSVTNATISMYGKCGSLDDALMVFSRMHQRNVVSWNALFAAYAQQGDGKHVLQLFQQMDLEGVQPDEITFTSVISICACLGYLEEGKGIHSVTVHVGVKSDLAVGNALVNMYAKCGSLQCAQRVFDTMLQHDTVSWNAILGAYAQYGHGRDALELFCRMQEENIKPNEITFVSVLSACSHAGLVDEGHAYFMSMKEVFNIEPTLEHYGCMIDLLGRAGRLKEAEDLISKMSAQPDAAAWDSLLSACRNHGDKERAKRAAEFGLQLDCQHGSPYSLLSSIYAAEGRMDHGEKETGHRDRSGEPSMMQLV